MLFLLIFFLETVKAEEEDQVGPQTQESPHDSSTDSCSTFPYSSNSPRPFPPSPVHSVSDSPKRVSPLPIATSNLSSDNSAIHSPIVHNLPTPVLFTPTTNSYNTPSYFPFSSNSFPQLGPIVFPGSPPDYPYFRTSLSGSNSTFSNTVSLPSYPLPSIVTSTTLPTPSFPIGSQFTSGPRSLKRSGRGSRGTYSGRRRAPRGRRCRTTSSTSCQTSPIPSYFWPDYQPNPISSGDSSANNALNLALMPRVFNHSPTNPPLNPLHYDFFTVLRATSPVVTFHCPSPLTQRSFSFVYSLSFTRGLDPKPLLVAGINQ